MKERNKKRKLKPNEWKEEKLRIDIKIKGKKERKKEKTNEWKRKKEKLELKSIK